MKIKLDAKKLLGLRLADCGAKAGEKGGYTPPTAMAGIKGGAPD